MFCGITNQADATAAIAAGANALGFNFYPGSPRCITPELAAAIETPPALQRVGIFVDETPARVEEIARAAALDIAQLHGKEELPDYPTGLPVWKAIRIIWGFDLSTLGGYPGDALLLDGPVGGKPFDWQAVRGVHRRIILAGGLDASNVGMAVKVLGPWGVDACSRIESAPGKKDHKKMNEFIQAARAALGL
jgi:phosphoribosylanthranilate isomerase